MSREEWLTVLTERQAWIIYIYVELELTLRLVDGKQGASHSRIKIHSSLNEDLMCTSWGINQTLQLRLLVVSKGCRLSVVMFARNRC